MYCRDFLRLLPLAFLFSTSHFVMADETSDFILGKKLFSSAIPPCGICHTLKDAGSEGAVGPILDELKPSQLRVVTALNNGIGAMPPFKGKLSPEEINAIAIYVSKASASN
ncbi:sulfite dehydrogenase (cytochrome) subunit SorB [Polynucleobacter kasalickyi]|uniref:Sulfite dehydrogenase (Cytochrome) subunit SorB n=2 Tax=Polynucleobacter kasalickyi TaxID=1938817 RepID=A0A1W2A5A1_9BURK|nr:sulfite dehydrogenase (cytochrome) subunit SorB [Polynucleobacter kasalickyi]